MWQPSNSGVHHLGYWSDDVAADSAALVAQGYEMEITGPGPDGVPMWAYHRHPTGPRIELVTRRAPMFETYWATGKSPF